MNDIPSYEEIAAKVAEKKLYEFVKQSWHVLHPNDRLIDGWHLGAICEHLEAVTSGQIKKLIINIAPRTTKSVITSVDWPAWAWIRQPQLRWVFTGFNQKLTTFHSVWCRRLIDSEWYQSKWGNKFFLTTDQNEKMYFENNRQGARSAFGMTGVTGQGGDVNVCFPFEQKILTERGEIPIGKIVEERLSLKVFSCDLKTGHSRLQSITGWHENPGARLIRIKTDDGDSLICTEDHRILTDSGWLEARSLRTSSQMATVDSRQVLCDRPPTTSTPYLMNLSDRKVESRGNLLGANHGSENKARLFARDLNSRLSIAGIAIVAQAVSDVLLSGSIGKIFRQAIERVAVEMPNVVSWRSWADECKRYQDVSIAIDGFPINAKNSAWVTVRNSAGENSAADGKSIPLGVVSRTGNAADSTERGSLIVLEAWDSPPLLQRVVAVEDAGFAARTFCISVHHDRCFQIAGSKSNYIVANCDDPHDRADWARPAQLQKACDVYESDIYPAVNDPNESRRVVTMQRIHRKDLTGFLEQRGDWEKLIIPTEYDPKRSKVSSIGWRDPRRKKGELLNPRRYSAAEVASLKKKPRTYNAQHQQAPSSDDGRVFKRLWFRYYLEDPYELARRLDLVILSVDASFKDFEESSQVALQVWGKRGADRLLLDRVLDHFDFVKTVEAILLMQEKWGEVLKAKVIEDKANGTAIISALRHRVPGIIGWPPEGFGRMDSKISRALAEQHVVEAGNIWLPSKEKYPWVEEFVSYCVDFPDGDYDDDIDAFVQAQQYLTLNHGIEEISVPVGVGSSPAWL